MCLSGSIFYTSYLSWVASWMNSVIVEVVWRNNWIESVQQTSKLISSKSVVRNIFLIIGSSNF
jgi:hypothetical protein